MDSIERYQKAEKLIKQKCRGMVKTWDESSFESKDLEVYRIELSMQNEELQRAGLEIESSRDKYRKLYDFAPVGFFTIDIHVMIQEVNRTGAALFGVEKDYFLGKVFTKFVVAEYQHTFSEYFQQLQWTKTKQECELKLCRSDGTYFYALVEGIAEDGKDRRDALFFIAVRDITEQKKSEEERLKYDRLEALGILAGGIAHDFNNLLTVISGNISLAKTNCFTKEKNQEILSAAEKACMQTRDLTRQLLTFAKGGTPIKEIVSIGQLLKDTVIFAMRGSNVRYELILPDDLWMLEVDGGQISQVVNNLIINANQAMPDGGTVFLRCENIQLTAEDVRPLKPGPYLKISVNDHGVGIHKDQLNRIFDPYFTTKANGSGLGLATSYSIVKRHDGHICIESEPGQGTTVFVYLPASPGVALSDKIAIMPPVYGRGKILVMDDEITVSNVIGEMLAQLGYDASFASEGREAVRLYREARERGEPYDAVIFDLTIPGGVGGKHAITELIKIDPHVKAIVSSGYSNDAIMSDFRNYGFRAVIPKPFCLEELSRIVWDTVLAPASRSIPI